MVLERGQAGVRPGSPNRQGYLSRGEDAKSLADNKEVAQLLKDPAIAIGYTDTRAVAELLYPILQFTAPVICQAMRQEGFDITPDVLPSAKAIYPHLLPGAYAIRRKADGIHFESHQSARRWAARWPCCRRCSS